MPVDIVQYLNGEPHSPMYSKLLQLIDASKQAKAPVAQWLSMIGAFTQKGVKQIEMDESGLLRHLATYQPGDVLSKDELLEQARAHYYTIKEVRLGVPKYPSYRQPGGSYREYLYIANSQRANVEDALEDVNWEMEELNFYPERIAENPGRVMALEKRREALMKSVVRAVDFSQHHFSDKIEGKHGKNLLVHCRVSVHGDIYFIEEIQSDWAQRGRQWDWKRIPRGPLVTNTEAWAGMVIRRQMQIAAGMPGIRQFAWITESMRNGGKQNLTAERAKDDARKQYRAFVASETEERLRSIGAESMTHEQLAAAKGLIRPAIDAAARSQGIAEPNDMLNDFYIAMIPKLADKALGKSGAKIAMRTMTLDSLVAEGGYGSRVLAQDNVVEVPGVELTPPVREILLAQQPVYSRAPLHCGPIELDAQEQAIAQALMTAREMLGSDKHVRFATHVYDVASGRKVAGRYINKLVQVSLRAADIVEATEHECFHFATDNLMRESEVAMLRKEFAPGTELNFRVRTELTRRGMYEAAAQCEDPLESAAHGFTLWKRGHVSVTERPIHGIFSDLIAIVKDSVRWLQRTVLEYRVTNAQELFQALAAGEMAAKDSLADKPRETGSASVDPGAPNDECAHAALSRFTG